MPVNTKGTVTFVLKAKDEASASLGKFDKKIDQTIKKLEKLNSMNFNKVEKEEVDLTKTLTKLNTELDKTTKKFERLNQQKVDKIKKEQIQLTSTIDKLNTEIDEATKRLDKLNRQNTDQISNEEKELTLTIEKLNTELDEATRRLDKLNRQNLDNIQRETKEEAKNLDNIEKESKEATKALKEIDAVSFGLIASGTMLLSSGLYTALQNSVNFTFQMDKLKAVTQATDEQMRKTSNTILDLGAKTTKTNSEIAETAIEMGKLGFSIEDVNEALPGVVKGAEATGESLLSTGMLISVVKNQFDLTADSAERLADGIVIAANKSAAGTQYLLDAFKYAGPPAKALDVDLSELTASMMVLADSGLAASQAGTTLRSILTRLAAPTEKMIGIMDELGIEVFDNNGNFIGLTNTLLVFNKAFEKLNPEQQAFVSNAVAGKTALSGFLVLVKEAPTKLQDYTKALNDSTGAANEASAAMRDNLVAQLNSLMGSIEAVIIKIVTLLEPALLSLIKVFIVLANIISFVLTIITSFINTISNLVNSLGEAIFGTEGWTLILQLLGTTLKLVIGFLIIYISYCKLAAIGQKILKIATNKQTFALLRQAAAFLLANWWILVLIGGIALLIVAYKRCETVQQVVNKLFDAFSHILEFIGNILNTYVIPAFEKFTNFLKENVLPVLKEVFNWIKENVLPILIAILKIQMAIAKIVLILFKNIIEQIVIPILKALQPLLEAIAKILLFLIKILLKIIQIIGKVLKPILNALTAFLNNVLLPILEFLADILNNVIIPLLQWLGDLINTYIIPVFKFFANILTKVSNILTGTFKKALDIIMFPLRQLNNILQFINNALETMFGWLGAVGSAIGGVWDKITFWNNDKNLSLSNTQRLAYARGYGIGNIQGRSLASVTNATSNMNTLYDNSNIQIVVNSVEEANKVIDNNLEWKNKIKKIKKGEKWKR